MSDQETKGPVEPAPNAPVEAAKLNGKTEHPSPTPEESKPKTEILLSDGDKKALVQLNDTAQQLRRVFNEASLEAYQAKALSEETQQKSEVAYQAFITANQKIKDRLGEIAALEGINLDDPSKGRWNMNFADMTFKRIG
jgi:hypothetical protein